jgi:hypothetical protein
MMRSIALTIAGAALLGLTLVSTDVSARRGGGGGAHAGGGAHIGGGMRGGGFRTGGFRTGGAHFAPRGTFRRFGHGSRIGIYGYRYRHGYSCWRWRLTPLGMRRVWVCGYPYRRYRYPYW